MLKTKKFIAAASSLALAGGLMTASPVAANGGSYVEKLENASFTWGISDYAHSSLGGQNTPENTTGDVTFDADAKTWTFANGTGTRDTATGNTTLNFTGSIAVGKTNQGCYNVVLTNPSVTTDGNVGTLTASVSYQVFAGATCAANGAQTAQGSIPSVKILDLKNVAISDENVVSVGTDQGVFPGDPAYSTANPGYAGFAEEFTNFLAADNLANHFRYTGNTGSNAGRGAQPISADFDVAGPSVEVTDTEAVAGGTELTVEGEGFDPRLFNDKVSGMYVTLGQNAQVLGTGGDASSADKFLDAVPLFGGFGFPKAPDAEGKFETKLLVPPTVDLSEGPVGISTWAAHNDCVPAWRTFTQLNIDGDGTYEGQEATEAAGNSSIGSVCQSTPPATNPPTPPTITAVSAFRKPTKVRNAKRAKTTKRAAKVTWKAPKVSTKVTSTSTQRITTTNKAVFYQVRSTNKGGKKFGKWRKVAGGSFTFKNLKKGTYKFQVRAVSRAGAGAAVTIKYNKRK